MDYSVLLGVDTRNKEMRVGIIDYLFVLSPLLCPALSIHRTPSTWLSVRYPYDLLKFMESHGKRMMRGAAPTILHPLK